MNLICFLIFGTVKIFVLFKITSNFSFSTQNTNRISITSNIKSQIHIFNASANQDKPFKSSQIVTNRHRPFKSTQTIQINTFTFIVTSITPFSAYFSLIFLTQFPLTPSRSPLSHVKIFYFKIFKLLHLDFSAFHDSVLLFSTVFCVNFTTSQF